MDGDAGGGGQLMFELGEFGFPLACRGPYTEMMIEPDALQFVGLNEVRLGRRPLIYFSGCDYFRLARHPRLQAAARTTLAQAGLNVAASRRTTGNHRIYLELEAELADFFENKAALLVPDGYFAPLAAAQTLAGQFSHGLLDEYAHGALRDAASLLNCPVREFQHRDADDLARKVAKCGRRSRPLILTDGIFSHDGSVAPLQAYLKVLPDSACLLVDDAHGIGVLGATGKGTLEYEGVNRDRIIQCGTLSKAFGAYGGVILGPVRLREQIMLQSRIFAGTTPLPPPLAGAALAGLRFLRRNPSRRDRLHQNAAYFRKCVNDSGWSIPATPGPIIRLPSMDEKLARDLKSRLLAAGIYPPFLKYGTASTRGFFRFVISSEHARAQLDRVAEVLSEFKPPLF